MEVENAMGDGRGTLTREEPNSTIKWNVQTKMERKIKGRLERRKPSANKHCLPNGFLKYLNPNNNPKLRNRTLKRRPVQ
jgi:hypothetical protein